MKYISNGIEANLYAINKYSKGITTYLDLWKQTNKSGEFAVSLVPCYIVYSIAKTEIKNNKYYWWTEYYTNFRSNKVEYDGKGVQYGRITKIVPLLEQSNVLGITTGNVIVSNGVKYVELAYRMGKTYLYYLSNEYIKSVPKSTTYIEDVKDKADDGILYRGGTYYDPPRRGKNPTLPILANHRYFAFERNKDNRKLRRCLIIYDKPEYIYMRLDDLSFSTDLDDKDNPTVELIENKLSKLHNLKAKTNKEDNNISKRNNLFIKILGVIAIYEVFKRII